MADFIVGGPGCEFSTLVTQILKVPLATINLDEKWKTIANHLGLKLETIYGIQKKNRSPDFGTDGILQDILMNYRCLKHKEAKLKNLIDAFDFCDLNEIATSLRKNFKIPEPKPSHSKSVDENEPKPPLDNDVVDATPLSPGNSSRDGACLGTPRSIDYELWKVDKKKLKKIEIPPPSYNVEFSENRYELSRYGNHYALLINIAQFPGPGKRVGAPYDTHNLNNLFTAMNYDVEKHDDQMQDFTRLGNHPNSSIAKIIEIFKRKCVMNEAQSIIVFIGSHGTYGSLELPKDKPINLYNDIVYNVCDEPEEKPEGYSWHDIPKIFIVSACREPPKDSPMRLENAIVCYSCLPNEYSYRDADGTKYIKTFVDVMMKHGRENHFVDVLDMIESDVWKQTGKQQPNYDNFLQKDKKLYFNIMFE